MIKINGIGTDNEKNNIFFKQYEKFCQEWKDFVLDKSGKLEAKYSVWALKLIAEYKTNYLCKISIEKSSAPSPNLFVSSNVRRTSINISGLKFNQFDGRIELLSLKHRLLLLFSNEHKKVGRFIITGKSKKNFGINREIEEMLVIVSRVSKLVKFKFDSKLKSALIVSNELFNNFELLEKFEEMNVIDTRK